jgi:hypothetical protein
LRAHQARYLRLVQPQQLPVLFRSSLTAQLVGALLTATLTSLAAHPPQDAAAGQQEEQLDARHAVALLECLPRAPRFSMMVMCLTKQDKAALLQLWDRAAAAVARGSHVGARLAAVKQQYKL